MTILSPGRKLGSELILAIFARGRHTIFARGRHTIVDNGWRAQIKCPRSRGSGRVPTVSPTTRTRGFAPYHSVLGRTRTPSRDRKQGASFVQITPYHISDVLPAKWVPQRLQHPMLLIRCSQMPSTSSLCGVSAHVVQDNGAGHPPGAQKRWWQMTRLRSSEGDRSGLEGREQLRR